MNVSDAKTLVHVLRARAAMTPARKGYTFLADGEAEESTLTYAELDQRARAIAATLQQKSARGERALLLYPPGLDFVAAFFGCLYSGVVAVPIYPPDPSRLSRDLVRLQAIVGAARPSVALTTTAILSMAEQMLERAPYLRSMRWEATDALPECLAGEWRTEEPSPDALAFLQYTSGSTSTPKGVMVTHGNLIHNERMIQAGCRHTDRSTFVGWLPVYHDMGLIGNVLQPVYVGSHCVLMSPGAFLRKPYRWLRAISRYRAVTSGGPNFAYDLCVRKVTAEERATLDLGSWENAFNGAEPVRSDTIARFSETFASAGFRHEAFYPCYGLAEATLIVSGAHRASGAAPPVVHAASKRALERAEVAPAATDADARPLVGCGKSVLLDLDQDQRIAIVDPATLTRCPPGRVGEIWVMGPHVASGYWNDAPATARAFGARLAGEGPFLRTGDLGFLQDGELFVTGRCKDMILVRGRNHYPHDVEATVEAAHPAVCKGGSAAFAIEDDDEEQLVVAAEVDKRSREVDEGEVARAIRRAVAEEHELGVHAVVLLRRGAIPKTSSGKLQRHACRDAFLGGSFQGERFRSLAEPVSRGQEAGRSARAFLLSTPAAERRALVDAHLRAAVAAAARTAPAGIDPHAPMNGLGLDSLTIVELKNQIEVELGVIVPAATFLQGGTLATLADHVLAQVLAADPPAPAVPLPSREELTAEPPARRLDAVVAAIEDSLRPSLDAPFALFGHSMGAQPEMFRIIQAVTPAERREVFRLRHRICVEELDYTIPGSSPEEGLREDEDDHALIFLALDGSRPAGTVTINRWTDGPLSAATIANYRLASFAERFGRASILVGRKWLVAREYRTSPVFFQLVDAALASARAPGQLFAFLNCAPHLVTFYERLGCRRYAPPFLHEDGGEVAVPMGMLLTDHEHLKRTQSPILALIERLYADTPGERELLRAALDSRTP